MSHGEMSECPHDAESKSRDQLHLRSAPFPGDPREGKSQANGMLAKAVRTRGARNHLKERGMGEGGSRGRVCTVRHSSGC